jgi:hypothetical protein
MKTISTIKANMTQTKIAASLMLTAILSISGGLSLITNNTASANSINVQHRNIKSSKIQPVQIPENELPPPLDQGVVFREISSGGFAGFTYQTILRNDGILIRVRIGDANDSERSVRRVSLEEVKKFEKLLNKKNLEKFNNLSYPAPSGAADYITYTLTSEKATFQYNDISQDGLPNKLTSVVSAWNQIKTNAK